MFNVSKELKMIPCELCEEWVEVPVDYDILFTVYCPECSRMIDEAISYLISVVPDRCKHGVSFADPCMYCEESDSMNG